MAAKLHTSALLALLSLLSAACALPLAGSSGWVYSSRTNTCERASSGFGSLTEEECQKNLVAAATQQAVAAAAAQATAIAKTIPTATQTPRPPTSTPVPTFTVTPRPPTRTPTDTPVPTDTPLPTSTRTATPLPRVAPASPSPELRGGGPVVPGPSNSPATATQSTNGPRIISEPSSGPLSTHFEFDLIGISEERITEWAVIDPKGQVTKEDYHLSWIAEVDEPPGVYRVTASANGRVVAEGTFEVVHDDRRAAPRLTTSPAKGKRGTTFSLTFSGGQPRETITWVVTRPTGKVDRLPLTLNASGNYLSIEYVATPQHELGVYRHEIVRGSSTLATATFELTQ